MNMASGSGKMNRASGVLFLRSSGGEVCSSNGSEHHWTDVVTDVWIGGQSEAC